jgi:vacuolar-type H+-ATPase subunit H
MSFMTLENVLEYLETLSEEEQQEVFDLVKKRRIERRRSEIAENGRKTFEAMEKGTAKRGSVEEIKSYLLADEEE